MTDDLWGPLPDALKLKSPADILNEQATLLSEKTGHKLLGRVNLDSRSANPYSQEQASDFEHSLVIRAPALNDFEYTVCRVYHEVLTLYPVRLCLPETSYQHPDYVCDDEPEFKHRLGEILSSTRTKNILAALLKHIQSRRPSPALSTTSDDEDIPF